MVEFTSHTAGFPSRPPQPPNTEGGMLSVLCMLSGPRVHSRKHGDSGLWGRFFLAAAFVACFLGGVSGAATWVLGANADDVGANSGDRLLADYFRLKTHEIEKSSMSDIRQWSDWEAKRGEYRRQLQEMLGLDPLPERTPLRATINQVVEREGIVVESLHFQSRPGLYVTANLYRPQDLKGKAPAILYVCGHGGVKKDGVSYGNKTHYQHHGVWFARHGYVCLIIDSLQLGEIEATHHGTHHFGMWWWLSRGYTPAGVEAWNCIRSLDYLQSRPEVDGQKLGVTGRSGGGAYSWWIAALDDRIRVAVPVAGITDLRNHVVDGKVAGHCDCMFMVNTYRWDYPQVAALVAPRPLLLSNTDRDPIFPLDGVVRTYERTRAIYELDRKATQLGLNITAGPHKDTQELQVHALRWFDEHLKQTPRLIREPAEPLFQIADLRVFTERPGDQLNTTIHESFVPLASPPLPRDAEHWRAMNSDWRQALSERVFRGWPKNPGSLDLHPVWDKTSNGVRLQAFDFWSEQPYRLRLYIAGRADLKKADLVTLNVMDDAGWREFLAAYQGDFGECLAEHHAGKEKPTPDKAAAEANRKMFATFPWLMAYVAPRGVGPTSFDDRPRERTHLLRRFYLLGETLESSQVWDVRRAIQALRSTPWASTPVWLQSADAMAGVALYASLFEPDITRLDLHRLPSSHRAGPPLLNVMRFLDTPQALALAAEHSRVVVYQDRPEEHWEYVRETVQRLDWNKKQLQFRPVVLGGAP